MARMCNRYAPATPEEVLRYFESTPAEDYRAGLGPWQNGPFIRSRAGSSQAVVGMWALIGDAAKRPPRPGDFMTNNCRSETVATKVTFKGPWLRGQRCIVPASSFDEPRYLDGLTNTWWRFQRTDGAPWALAGIWNDWTDPVTGEIVPSYSMLTMNADAHPLMSLMHKPEPHLPPDRQDKRTVIPLERAECDTWLHGTVEDAWRLIRLPAMEVFDHGPAEPVAPRQSSLL
jgi:putative SOS response-associated peptidase YedK